MPQKYIERWGHDIPARVDIPDLSSIFKQLDEMPKAEIDEFVKRTKKYINNMKKIFQVEFYSHIENNIFSVEGRFLKGELLQIGNIFNYYKDKSIYIQYEIVEIIMYNKSIPFIDIGMTGRLILQCDLFYENEPSFELISS